MTTQEYRSTKQFDPIWFITSATLSLLILMVDEFLNNFGFHRWLYERDIGRIIFFYYSIIFICFWIIYFSSPIFRVQSLRVFLMSLSSQWNNFNSSEKQQAVIHDKLVTQYEEKGKVTITAQSILITISTLMIVNIYRRRIEFKAIVTPDMWEVHLLNISLVFSVAAFVLLIYAVDCLDTIFNAFKDKELEIKHYFYAISSRPKYYGMLCVIAALLFFIGSAMPTVSSFGMGLLLFVGYKFWCPDQELNDKYKLDFFYLFRLIMFILPLIVILARGDNF